MELIIKKDDINSDIQNEFIRTASKDFDNHLKNYIAENLKKFGFEFKSEFEFIQFVSTRITRVGYSDKHGEWELYIDIGTKNQKLIGMYSDNVNFSFEGSKVTATFGRILR